MKDITKNYYFVLPILLSFLFIIYIFLLNSLGFIMGGDSFTYLEWVQLIKNNDFSFINNKDEHSQKGYNYLVTVYIMYFFQIIYFQNWQMFFVYFNLCIFFLIFSLLLILLNKELKLIPILCFSLYIFFGNYEQFLWVRYLLTDYIFYLLVSLLFFMCFIYQIKKNIIYLIFIFLILVISFFTRPAFVVLFLIVTTLLIINICIKSRLYKFLPLFLLLYFFCFAIFFELVIFLNLLEGKFADLSFKKIFGYYQEGIIVRNRLHTYIEINQINLLNLLKLFFLKFIYFFVFWDQLYSLKHNILNTIIFFPIYFFAGYSLFKFKTLTNYQKNLVINCLVFIFCFAFFHSLTLIDYDWRFRLPIYLPLNIVSIIGFLIFLYQKNYKLYFNDQTDPLKHS